jgi:cytidine deaminase
MNTVNLTEADVDLIEQATETIRPVYVPGSEPGARAVGAALRTESGAVYTGVNLTAATPRASVCAEPVAIGEAVTDGETEFDTIVAVLFNPDAEVMSEVSEGELFADAAVISACGVCRELIRDYDPSTYVIIRTDEGLQKTRVDELIPALTWRKGGT